MTSIEDERSREPEILGYCSSLVEAPGSSLDLFVSSPTGRFEARVVALDEGEGDGPGRWSGATDLGAHDGGEQSIATGSCAVIPKPSLPHGGPLTIQVSVWPTLPRGGRPQGILASCTVKRDGGFWLGLGADGRVELTVGCEGGMARVLGPGPLLEREWYRLTATVDSEGGRIVLTQEALSPWLIGVESVEGPCPGAPRPFRGPLVMAASHCSGGEDRQERLSVIEPFNGKLARPWAARRPGPVSELLQRALEQQGTSILGGELLSDWDLGRAAGGRVIDRGPARAGGYTVNNPTAAVTGPGWTGREVDFRQAPGEYDALHFHDDDLEDARWRPALEISIPEDCPSGLYGVSLQADGSHDVVPFMVTARRGSSRSRAAVWLATYTYQAYANQRWSPAEAVALERLSLLEREAVQPGDRHLDRHPELGLSVYDLHRDGSPCSYSSRLRPIVNLRPDHIFRHTGQPREFAADVRFLRWLRERGRDCDLITDHDVDREGQALLDRYRVVMTGCHPEYVTDRIHTSLEGYVTGTGRFMYLGGNGMYWVTGVDPERPHVIEVRRGHGATNPTGDSPPGESHLSTTGEPGGIWRFRGRSAQSVLGVGTTAMGWGEAGGYAWGEAAAEGKFGYVTAGLERERPLGPGAPDFPWGAAADEIDRADRRLGTPPTAVLLASSQGRHDERIETVAEDSGYAASLDAARELVRADMVMLQSPFGGWVFSVGSMGWSSALWHSPEVGRVTENVLDEFLSE